MNPYSTQAPIRIKTVTDNTKLERVNMFVYLECRISDEEKKDITLKISKHLQILRILNNILKPDLLQGPS
jgi:hypothetical protein